VAIATIIEFQSAVSRSLLVRALAYQSNVQPVSGNFVTLLLLKLNKISVTIGRYRKTNAQKAASATALFQKSKGFLCIVHSGFNNHNQFLFYPRFTRPVFSNRSDIDITIITIARRITEIADPSGQFIASPNCDVTTLAIMLE